MKCSEAGAATSGMRDITGETTGLGLGYRVQGLGFRVWGLGFRV